MRAAEQFVNRESSKLFARRARNNPTPAEAILWELLCSKGLGVRCRRQKLLLKRYFVDFYVPRWKLVIEVDGSAHDNEWAKDRDARRDADLKAAGFRVLRLSNDEILANVKAVFSKIIGFQASHDDIAALHAALPDPAGFRGRHPNPSG